MSVNLADLLDYLDGAKFYGTYIAAKCPFHDDSKPSLIIHEDTYTCLACGSAGRTDKLYEKISNTVKYHKDVPAWKNPFTQWIQSSSLEGALANAHHHLVQHPSIYLRHRGIPDTIQINAKLGWMDGWYTFPIRNQKRQVIGGVARKDESNPSTSKYVVPHGQDANMLYVPSWWMVERSETIFLTFGIIDSISLCILGHAGISTTGGKRLDPRALDWCRKRIIIIPDRNEESEGLKLSANLGWRGSILKIDWPNDCKDVNDMLIKHPKSLEEVINGYNMDRFK